MSHNSTAGAPISFWQIVAIITVFMIQVVLGIIGFPQMIGGVTIGALVVFMGWATEKNQRCSKIKQT